jgi:hypothetical protein
MPSIVPRRDTTARRGKAAKEDLANAGERTASIQDPMRKYGALRG